MQNSQINEKQNTHVIIGQDLAKVIGISLIILSHINQVLKIGANFLFYRPLYYLFERIFYIFGHYGVSLFLVASGFGLTFSLLKKEKINWKQWYVNHLLKLFLLFWISYLFYIFLFNWGYKIWPALPHISLSSAEFIATFLGLQAYFGYWGGKFNQVYWFNTLILSLYVIFPLLFLWLRKNRLLKLIIILTISIISGIVIIGYSLKTYRFLFIPHLFEFSVGIIIAYLYTKHNNNQGKKFQNIFSSFYGFLFLSIVVGIFTIYYFIRGDTLTVLLITISGPLLYLAILIFSYKLSVDSLILKPFTLIAKHSHALFLFHLPLLSLYNRIAHIQQFLFMLIYFIVIVCCVWLGQKMADRLFKIIKKLTTNPSLPR